MIDIPLDTKTILILVGIAILFFMVGHLVGRMHGSRIHMEPEGKIIFTTYQDENNEETSRCTFKLDLDIDEIEKEKYIIFEVVKE